MAKYMTIGPILQGEEATLEQAQLICMDGTLFEDSEPEEQNISYAYFQDTVNGIDIYYDYGADYYFFCETTR